MQSDPNVDLRTSAAFGDLTAVQDALQRGANVNDAGCRHQENLNEHYHHYHESLKKSAGLKRQTCIDSVVYTCQLCFVVLITPLVAILFCLMWLLCFAAVTSFDLIICCIVLVWVVLYAVYECILRPYVALCCSMIGGTDCDAFEPKSLTQHLLPPWAFHTDVKNLFLDLASTTGEFNVQACPCCLRNEALSKLDEEIGTRRDKIDQLKCQPSSGVKGTALTFACQGGHTPCVKFLLSVSADINIPDSENKTALERATESKKKEIIDELEARKHVLEKERQIKELEGGPLYPMYVCTRKGLMKLSTMMKHEAAKRHKYNNYNSLVIQLPSNSPPRLTLFVSHRWTSDAHPDQDAESPESDNKKLRALKLALNSKELLHVEHIWIDFLSIPQDREHSADQESAINSLPFYVRQCGHFVSIYGTHHPRSLLDIYKSRGWCMLEMFASFSSVSAQIMRCNMDAGEGKMLKLLSRSELVESIINPLIVHFSGKEEQQAHERRRISPMLFRLCAIVLLEQNDEGIMERAREIQNYIYKNGLLETQNCK